MNDFHDICEKMKTIVSDIKKFCDEYKKLSDLCSKLLGLFVFEFETSIHLDDETYIVFENDEIRVLLEIHGFYALTGGVMELYFGIKKRDLDLPLIKNNHIVTETLLILKYSKEISEGLSKISSMLASKTEEIRDLINKISDMVGILSLYKKL
ncbi:MAG: hypothetical protein QXL06_01850 [Nitrososphaerota archaeon]